MTQYRKSRWVNRSLWPRFQSRRRKLRVRLSTSSCPGADRVIQARTRTYPQEELKGVPKKSFQAPLTRSTHTCRNKRERMLTRGIDCGGSAVRSMKREEMHEGSRLSRRVAWCHYLQSNGGQAVQIVACTWLGDASLSCLRDRIVLRRMQTLTNHSTPQQLLKGSKAKSWLTC